jgi:hypothetical protein
MWMPAGGSCWFTSLALLHGIMTSKASRVSIVSVSSWARLHSQMGAIHSWVVNPPAGAVYCLQ